jgi:hypothetical protein
MPKETTVARKPPHNKSRQPKDDELLWLETYFIVFPHNRRPTLAQVEQALVDANPRLTLDNLAADDEGLFASVLVQSPEDHAAVEISYECGEAVIEQNLEWAKQLQKQITAQQLQQLVVADARLDVAHFERMPAGEGRGASKPSALEQSRSPSKTDDDESLDAPAFVDDFDGDDFDEEAALEIFDPSCLLTVVESLSALTRGLAFDPAAGEVV